MGNDVYLFLTQIGPALDISIMSVFMLKLP